MGTSLASCCWRSCVLLGGFCGAVGLGFWALLGGLPLVLGGSWGGGGWAVGASFPASFMPTTLFAVHSWSLPVRASGGERPQHHYIYTM